MEITTHTPVRGWTAIRNKKKAVDIYYNPHPRMGVNFHLLLPVSEIQSFNPHPRMGMNAKRRKVRKAQREFQPTPPYGDERTGAFLLPLMCIISTHTPAGGWTWFLPAFSLLTFYYNPHPRMGDEQLWSSADSDLSKFQSSPPYGDECDIIEFNKTIFTISTHIPAWGWTKGLSCKLEDLYITTHTPAWGWTIHL